MYEIDPTRTDLIEEFDQNPGGPYSPELTSTPALADDVFWRIPRK